MVVARSRQVALSSMVGVSQRLAQVAATLVTMPLVLHALGIEGFGIWGAAASMAWMTATVDFGISNALLTGVARAMAGRDFDGVRAEVSAALTVAAGLTLVVLGLAVPAVFLLASPADKTGLSHRRSGDGAQHPRQSGGGNLDGLAEGLHRLGLGGSPDRADRRRLLRLGPFHPRRASLCRSDLRRAAADQLRPA